MTGTKGVTVGELVDKTAAGTAGGVADTTGGGFVATTDADVSDTPVLDTLAADGLAAECACAVDELLFVWVVTKAAGVVEGIGGVPEVTGVDEVEIAGVEGFAMLVDGIVAGSVDVPDTPEVGPTLMPLSAIESL